MNASNDVIEKLKKVLNLATRGATEGEMEAAWKRAKEIAMRYNIDLASVDVSDSKSTSKKKAEAGKFSIRSKYEQPYHRWVNFVLEECFDGAEV